MSRANYVVVPDPLQKFSAETPLDQLLRDLEKPAAHAYALKDISTGHLLFTSVAYNNSLDAALGDELTLELEPISDGLRPLLKPRVGSDKALKIDRALKKEARAQRLIELSNQSSAMIAKGKLKEAELACNKILNMAASEDDLANSDFNSAFTTLARVFSLEDRVADFERLMAYLFYIIKVRNVKMQPEFALTICDYIGFLSNEFRFVEAEELIEFGMTLEASSNDNIFTLGLLSLALTKINLDSMNFVKALEAGHRTEGLFKELDDEDNDFAVRLKLFLGKAYEETENLDKALEYYQDGLEIIQKDEEVTEELVIFFKSIGIVKLKKGMVEECLDDFKKAFENCLGLEGSEAVLDVSTDYASALTKSEQYDEALEVLSRAMRKCGRHPELLMIEGEVYNMTKKYDKTVDTLQEAFASLSQVDVEPAVIAEMSVMLSEAQESLEDLVGAEATLRSAVEKLADTPGAYSYEVYYAFAELLSDKESRLEEAEELIRTAGDLAKEYFGESSIEYAKALEVRATILIDSNKFEGVTDVIEKAIAIKTALEGEESASLLESYLVYAALSLSIQDLERVSGLFDKALELIRINKMDPDEPEVKHLFELVNQFNVLSKDPKGREQLMQQIEALKVKTEDST
jgi:tetratricopeptide (TPR) repeat protein